LFFNLLSTCTMFQRLKSAVLPVSNSVSSDAPIAAEAPAAPVTLLSRLVSRGVMQSPGAVTAPTPLRKGTAGSLIDATSPLKKIKTDLVQSPCRKSVGQTRSPDKALACSSRSRSPPPRRRSRTPPPLRRSSAAACEAPRKLVGRRSSMSPLPGRLSFATCGRQSLGNRLRRSIAANTRRSFPHKEFANPQAETCWLSCLFQSLWHSVVFHYIFEEHLAHTKYTPEADECILAALQQTWLEYQKSGASRSDIRPDKLPADSAVAASMEPRKLALDTPVELSSTFAELAETLVAPDGLVEAFGVGYGMMTLVPVMPSEDDGLPTPQLAWKQVEEWGLQGAALLAADLNASLVSAAGNADLAALWMPRPSSQKADFGAEHSLVALVCYMPRFQHYTAFIRRQREPLRCLFFNDLPDLTDDALREIAWEDVPEMCSQFGLTPRLALYESNSAATKSVNDMAALLGGFVE